MKIAFLCTLFFVKKTLITSFFYWLGGTSGQNIYRWELQYRLHQIYTSLSVGVHIFVSSWKLLFLNHYMGKIVIYLFKSRSNILYKILCIHSIKIEGLVLQKTCRYKEITCGVPQGSVLGSISYLVQK